MSFRMDLPTSVAVAVSLAASLAGLLLWRRRKAMAMEPREEKPFPILSRRVVSNNELLPVLELTIGTSTQAMPTGSHVAVSFTPTGGKKVVRYYTPTRFDSGACELLLRVYPEGIVTQHLFGLSVGDMVTMRGPTGQHRYGTRGPGSFAVGKRKLYEGIKHVGLLAGGTGITPMLQIVNDVLKNASDQTSLHLLAANSTVDDVMLYERLTDLALSSKGQLSLEWTVSRQPEKKWNHLVGRISREMLQTTLPAPAEDTLVCLCGPPSFNEAAKEILTELGHNVILTW